MEHDNRDYLNEPPLDPRRERLVSYLYDELPPSEAAQVRRWLDDDPALRAEWEELTEARAFLRTPDEAAAPEFAFLNPLAAATPVGSRSRFRAGPTLFPRFRPSAAWVFAAATLALAGLLLAGLRVDRAPQGLVLHFGTPAPRTMSPDSLGPTPALPPPIDLATAQPIGTTPTLQPVSADVVTPDQLRRTAEAMMETVAAILEQREDARREEMGYLLRAFYERIRDEEDTRYGDLRDQIQGVGLGLLAEQTRTAARLDKIINAPVSSQPNTGNDTATPGREDERP